MSEQPPAPTDRAEWSADATFDATGLRCPLPVLKARKRLLALSAGKRLHLIADDPMSAIDVPHFCSESGHRLVARDEDGEVLHFLVERV